MERGVLTDELSPLCCHYHQEASPRKPNWAIQRSSAFTVAVPSTNETSTPLNYLEFPTDIVLLVVLWRLRYKLSLRDGAEVFLERGFVFTHETVRDWQERFAQLIADHVRKKRCGQRGEILVCG